jgi:hypothetical protein
MALSTLAAGHGPETFSANFARQESIQLARAFPDFSHESPHNMFLDAFVDQGIPALLCLMALCLYGWRSAGRPVAAALVAGVVAQQFTVFTIPTALLFYVTVAVAAPKPSAVARLPRFTLIAAAVVFLFVAFRVVSADRSLALVRRDLASADLQSADAHFRDYLRRKLPGASADLWYSRSLFSVAGQAPDALRRLQALQMASVTGAAATVSAEDPFNAWYNLANVRAAQGDAAGTESALRSAIAARPNWFKPHWTLARLLAAEGRRAEALSEARVAAFLSAGKFPEVTATLPQP